MIETKFKQTELGLIPEDWEVCKIGDFTDVVTGATPSTENSNYWDGHIRWMNSSELNDKIIFEVHGRISKEGYDSASTHLLPTNCVLIGLAGQGKTRGTAAINKIELCTNQSIGAILPSENIDSDYLYLYMDSQYQNLRTISSGDGGRGGLSKSLLVNFEIVKPNNVDEQKQVAEALSDVDKLISELDTLIEKKRSIMQGTMQNLLTARRRLPGFNEQWKSMTFEAIGALIRGVGFSPEQSSHKHKRGSMPLLRANNIKNNSLIFDELIYVSDDCVKHTQVLREADILICTANGSPNLVGKSVILPQMENFTFGAFMTILRCHDKRIAKYIIYFMRSSSYRKQITDLLCGSAINNLNSRQLYTISVQCPSNIDEMNEIATVLSDMNDEIEEIEAKKNKYIAVRQGMMQQLLTGKIRLI